MGRSCNWSAYYFNIHGVNSISPVCHSPVAPSIFNMSPFVVDRVGIHIALSPCWGVLIDRRARCFSPQCVPLLRIVVPHRDDFFDY